MRFLHKRVWLVLAGAVAAAVGVMVVKKRRVPRFLETGQPLKTIADIRPPKQMFSGYDQSKAQSGLYASTHRAALVAARPWTPR